MNKDISISEYYAEQRRIADTYDISDNHAGCYVCKFPTPWLCAQCPRGEECEEIFKKEEMVKLDD